MKKKLFLTALLALFCCALLLAGASAEGIEPKQPTGDGTEANPYQIGTKAELYWFAELVNGTGQNEAACAVLTADITVNENVLKADGSLNGSNFDPWTPIGTSKTYDGTFDGKGHTISGLYCSVGDGHIGLFSVVGSGTVQNVKIKDSYFKTTEASSGFAGGVCGMINSPNGEITNCSFSGSVSGKYAGGICGRTMGPITDCNNTGSVIGSGDNSYAGGVCAEISSNLCTIANCYNSGDVISDSSAGGVCGTNGSGEVKGCYNNGSVSGSGYVGGVCGKNEKNKDNDCIITNCLWLDTVADNGVGSNVGQVTVTNVKSLTDAQFAAGEAAYLLNRAEGGGVWTVGEDGYPVLRPGQKIVVYRVTVDGVIYYSASDEGFKLPEAPYRPGCAFLGWSDGSNTFQSGDIVGLFGDTAFTSVWVRHPDTPATEPEPEEPATEPVLPFYDVSRGDWFYDAVCSVYGAGLMDGVGNNVFAPNDTLTRAMFWTILARASGVDTSGGATWYAKAQEWAAAKGVSDGEQPDGPLTREQLVTMLWRLNGEPVVDYLITAPDAAQISSWALEAVRWAASTGLMEGDETGALSPAAPTTRAQAATFIWRYLSLA